MNDEACREDGDSDQLLVELIYESSLDETAWPELLTALGSRFRCCAIGISRGSRDGGLLGQHVIDLHSRKRSLVGGRWQSLLFDDPVPYHDLEPCKVYRMTDLLDPADPDDTPYYREFLEPAGYESFLCLSLGSANAERVLIFLYRDRSGGPYGDDDVDRCQRLISHMQRAFLIHQRVHENVVVSRVYDQAMERLNLGVLILDPQDGRVLSSNCIARDILSRRDVPVHTRDGRLVLRHDLRERFQAIVARVLSTPSGEASEVMSIPCEGEFPLGLLVQRYVERRQMAGPDERVVVYVSDPSSAAVAPPVEIARLFGLSPAEARLASQLVSGLTLVDAARALGLSEASTRTYSKRIYAKVGVSRQADLVRILLRSVAALSVEPG